jgi:hypothetical protein
MHFDSSTQTMKTFCTRAFLIAASLVTVAGCGNGSGLSGTYGDPAANAIQLVFDSGDKVTIKLGGALAGIVSQGTYKLNGKEVDVFDPQGRGMTLTIDGNGCLTGGLIQGAACKQ